MPQIRSQASIEALYSLHISCTCSSRRCTFQVWPSSAWYDDVHDYVSHSEWQRCQWNANKELFGLL